MTTLPRGLWLPWGRRLGPEPGECMSLQANSLSRWASPCGEHGGSTAAPLLACTQPWRGAPAEAPPAEVGPSWRLQSSPGGWGRGAGPPRRLWMIIVKDSNVNENIKAIFKFCFY